MDLASECPARESVQDDNEVTQEQKSHVDYKNNGLSTNESEKLSYSGNFNTHLPVGMHQMGGGENSPSSAIKSPSGPSSPASKGHGLKKWKRIRRDAVRDRGGAIVDGSKILKRDFSASENPTKRVNAPPAEVSEGSIGSIYKLNNGGAVDLFAVPGSSKDSIFAVGLLGTESVNSEDRSSKSSTAASAPKMRSDVLGNARERNKPKNLSGKSVAQCVHQGKGNVESSKKHRGGRVKIEEENSLSSIESDSRSSNFVFMQSLFSATSNGKPSEMSMNYDGENSEEAHASEPQFSEEVQTGYNGDNVAEDCSWDGKEERSESHQQTSCDPLTESARNLQTIQEALKKEVQKFGEIGIEPFSLNHDSVNDGNLPEGSTVGEPEVHESSHFKSEKIKQNAPSSLEMQVLSLRQDVKYLETKLEETMAVLELKTLRVADLEVTLNASKVGSTVELENELESLLQQKIEDEIEFLALTRTIPNLIEAAGNITLFEEEKALVEEQTQTLNNLGEAKTKALTLKKQVGEIEKHCSSIVDIEEVLKIQIRVYGATSRFLMQLVLLLLAIWLFVVQLSPHSGEVVPT